jgi:hypothetical protein
MRRRALLLAVLGTLMTLALAATAAADVTLGTTTQPSGSMGGTCGSGLYSVLTSAGSPTDTVPAAGGRITQWQTNTTGETAGAALSLVVLRPVSANNYTVVAIDNEALPNPLPVSNVATFTVATPITVNAGDILAVYAPADSTIVCLWHGGPSIPTSNIGADFLPATTPTVGGTETVAESAPGYLVNVAANLAPAVQDASVATSAPSNAAAGHVAVLSSSVTNGGSGSAPITFTENVPAGLAIDAVFAANGSCSTTAQTVTCTISGLASGQSAPVDVLATPSAPGNYTNSVSVAVGSGATDPNSANNTASAAFGVGRVIAAKCVVPKLKGISAGFAKTVLKDLGCKPKLKHQHSSVHKGDVIGTSPGPGTHAYRTKVTVKVSSGKKH